MPGPSDASSADQGGFSDAPAGRTAQPCPFKKHFITFEFKDALGNDAAGKCLLEHPDGRLEEVTHDGILHRDDVPAGDYKVHFAQLLKAAWHEQTDAITLPEAGKDEPLPKVALSVEHQAFSAGDKATFSVRYELAPSHGTALFEGEATLTRDESAPLGELTTRLAWDLRGLPDVAPGEAVSVVFEVAARGQRLVSAPLAISRPPSAAKEIPLLETEPTFIAFTFKDALGNPAQGPVVLEHPDGHFEDVTLDEGVVYRENVAGGTYKVHFPALTEIRWTKDAIEVTEQGALPPAEATLVHRAFPAGAQATYALRYASAPSGGEPLATGKAVLATTGGKLDARETKVTIALRDAIEVSPGEARVFELDVTVLGQRLSSAPLFVSRAAPAPLKIELPEE